MCGACYVLNTFRFSLVFVVDFQQNVCFCVCCATGPCSLACSWYCLLAVVFVHLGVLVGGHLPMLRLPLAVLYLTCILGCNTGQLLGSILPQIVSDFCTRAPRRLHHAVMKGALIHCGETCSCFAQLLQNEWAEAHTQTALI